MARKVFVVVSLIIVVGVGAIAYSFLKTPEEASGPIEAIPITADIAESTVADTGGIVTKGPDTAMEVNIQATADADEQLSIATPTRVVALSETNESSQEMAASPITFEIVPAASEARFLIDEVLRGDPITVVGTTNQVAGQFAVDPGDLASVQAGIIQVNARTLATDNDLRNRAIKNRILLTDDYEFVTFAPKEVIGLAETGSVKEPYTFQIVGDLTITDVTRQVTFDVTATAASEARIEGTATTAFPYTDFELFIPDAPAVDTVDDLVRLELKFVAEAV